jgi:hypothetical protein
LCRTRVSLYGDNIKETHREENVGLNKRESKRPSRTIQLTFLSPSLSLFNVTYSSLVMQRFLSYENIGLTFAGFMQRSLPTLHQNEIKADAEFCLTCITYV